MIVYIYGIFGYKNQFIICGIVKFCSIQNIYFYFIINFNNDNIILFLYVILFNLFKVLDRLNNIYIYI